MEKEKPEPMTFGDNYTPYAALQTEQGRIGITTCRICGAAVVLDEEHATTKHERWHFEHEATR